MFNTNSFKINVAKKLEVKWGNLQNLALGN